MSSTMTKRHAWLNPTDGARQAKAMSCSTAACRQGVGSKMPNVTPPRQEIAHCSVKPSPHAPYLDATDAPSPLPAAALLCYDRRDSERPPALRQSVAPGRSSHDLGG